MRWLGHKDRVLKEGPCGISNYKKNTPLLLERDYIISRLWNKGIFSTGLINIIMSLYHKHA